MKEKIALSSALIALGSAIIAFLVLLFGTDITSRLERTFDEVHMPTKPIKINASAIVVTAEGDNKPYVESFKQSLLEALSSAGMEDDDGIKIDIALRSVGADDVAEAYNFWRGHATVVLTLPSPTSLGQIRFVQSCTAKGGDANDAALNALAATASRLAALLQDYARRKTPTTTACFS
jgi:hypothetical protein